MRRRLVVAAAAVLLLLALGGGGSYLYGFSGLRATCLRSSAGVTRFQADDGTQLQGIVAGTGPAGVVLAPQSEQTACDLLPVARRLAAEGFRAVSLELPLKPFQDARWDRYLEAAVHHLRQARVTSVALMGASLGGAASIVAGAGIQPPVDGVVDLSGERRVSGLDSDRAAGASTVPLLLVASAQDHYLDGGDARALFQEARTSDKQLVLLPGDAHGTGILDGPQGPDVWRQVTAFLRAHRRRAAQPSTALAPLSGGRGAEDLHAVPAGQPRPARSVAAFGVAQDTPAVFGRTGALACGADRLLRLPSGQAVWCPRPPLGGPWSRWPRQCVPAGLS